MISIAQHNTLFPALSRSEKLTGPKKEFDELSTKSQQTENRSDEGLTLETSAFRISVRWPIYIINSVDKTKFLKTGEFCEARDGKILQRPLESSDQSVFNARVTPA